MKRFILGITLIILGFKGFTQTIDTTKNAKKDSTICLCCRPINLTKQPLWMINGKISQSNLSELNLDYIQNLNVYKGNEALSKYGIVAKNGVAEITLIKNIKSQSINKILSKNKIDKASRKLPIYFNSTRILRDSIYLPSDKKIKVLIVDANQNANRRLPDNGKYLAMIETK